jgi:riboflavin transport system substrate-binding protein
VKVWKGGEMARPRIPNLPAAPRSGVFMNHFISRLFVCVVACSLLFAACSKKEQSDSSTADPADRQASVEAEPVSIAVFIPGVVAGSPTYEALVEGVQNAAVERMGTTVRIVEGGFSQDQWSDTVMSLAASRDYSCIVTTNPALPEICEAVAKRFPDQKFVILDGYLENNPAIHTLLYNQMEQSYLIGHLAGLITSSSDGLSGANDALRVGLIAGQEYPIMNQVIRVGYEMGMKAVNVDIELDFRVVGNWYDATKAGSLASIMYDEGADVILAIAGGANQGIISEATRRGSYVLWFDSNGYSEAPGVVLGSSAVEQRRAAYEKTLDIIDGNITFGLAEVKGVREGFVTFIEDDPLYLQHVPEAIREQQKNTIESIQTGKLQLLMPRL